MNNEQIPNNNNNMNLGPVPNGDSNNVVGGQTPLSQTVTQEPVVQPLVENAAPTPPLEANPSVSAEPVVASSTPPLAQQVPNVNLNPVGVVQTPNVMPAAEPTPSPLMSTPLTADTNLNSPMSAPVANGMPQNMGQPQMPNSVPPQMNMMGPMPGSSMGVPVPPQVQSGNTKEKKPMNKTLLLVLVIVLILGIGAGVWFVLFGSKAKTTAVVVTPFVERIELGVQIDTSLASSFVSVSGMSAADCSVKTNIDTSKANTYEYTVTCGDVVSGPHTVVVSDTQAPVVTLKEVVVVPNAEVKPEDFIETIEDQSIDKSKEYVKFVDAVNTDAVGTYDVSLEITDLYGNSKTETAKLIVDENAPEIYYSCNLDGEESNQTLNYRFGVSSSGSIYNAVKKVVYTYEDDASYNDAVAQYNNNQVLNGVEGVASFDDTKRTISITTQVLVEDLPKEFDTEFFSEEFDISDILGDSCEIE